MEDLERRPAAGAGGARGAGRTQGWGPSRRVRGVSAPASRAEARAAGALSPRRVPRAEQGPFKALYNSQLRFRRRLYADLETVLYRVRLFQPLAQLLKRAALYVRRAVPPPVFQALSRCGRRAAGLPRLPPAGRRPALREGEGRETRGRPSAPVGAGGGDRAVLPAALTRGSVPSDLPLGRKEP